MVIDFKEANTVCMKKGIKVIDMAEIGRRISSEIKSEDSTNVYEAEPTEKELEQIAKNEKSDDKLALSDFEGFGEGEADFYFKQVGAIAICTPEEEIEYFKKIKAGDIKARDEFIKRNLKLVLSNAKYYSQRNSCFSIMDLIQEGNIGLLKAIRMFDPSKGYKFSTYATWWIKQAMYRGISDQARTIRIPVHMVESINKYKKVEKQFVQENGYKPTPAQMASNLNMSVRRVEEIMKYCDEPISLSTPVGDEEDYTLADTIKSEDIPVDEQAEQTELKRVIQDMLNRLTPRERNIIIARFGLDKKVPKTLEEVGKELNVTRERIRQIEAKALRKLKVAARSKNVSLKEFLG